MTRTLIALALLAASVAADIEITVLDTRDDGIQIGVTDTDAPRDATLEIRAVDARGRTQLARTINGTTPAAVWVEGLTPGTNYDLRAVVGDAPSQEAVATQHRTTLAGQDGRRAANVLPFIGARLPEFRAVLAASAEAVSRARLEFFDAAWLAAEDAVSAEVNAVAARNLERELAALPSLSRDPVAVEFERPRPEAEIIVRSLMSSAEARGQAAADWLRSAIISAVDTLADGVRTQRRAALRERAIRQDRPERDPRSRTP